MTTGNDNEELPQGLHANDPRWMTAELGAQLQELVDQLTPDGYPRQVVDTWIIIAETASSDGPRCVMTIPSDRFQIPKLLGMTHAAQQMLSNSCTQGYGG